MDVMEPVVEDREDLLRNEVIQLFGKYYRNVRQMTPEQRVAYRSQLSSLFARANEKLRNYVNLIVIREPHLKLEDVTGWLCRNGVPKRFWPERLELIDRIPHTGSGKVKKYLLKEELEKRMEGPEHND